MILIVRIKTTHTQPQEFFILDSGSKSVVKKPALFMKEKSIINARPYARAHISLEPWSGVMPYKYC